MFQVRFHGRGGQGVVTAAELLAEAAFIEGRHAQAFPSFGSERMGAPVMSFCRIDDKPIRTHEPVTEPDALIIQDRRCCTRETCSMAWAATPSCWSTPWPACPGCSSARTTCCTSATTTRRT